MTAKNREVLKYPLESEQNLLSRMRNIGFSKFITHVALLINAYDILEFVKSNA